MRLACQQRRSWTCMTVTKAFMVDNTTDTSATEQLTEEKAMRAFTRIFDGAMRDARSQLRS